MRLVFEISQTIRTDVDKALQETYFEKWNYKLQWYLRDIEDELKSQTKGLIVIPAIDSDLQIEIRGFDKHVAEKIYKMLKPICKPV